MEKEIKIDRLNETIGFYFSQWSPGRPTYETMDKKRMAEIFEKALQSPAITENNRRNIESWIEKNSHYL